MYARTTMQIPKSKWLYPNASIYGRQLRQYLLVHLVSKCPHDRLGMDETIRWHCDTEQKLITSEDGQEKGEWQFQGAVRIVFDVSLQRTQRGVSGEVALFKTAAPHLDHQHHQLKGGVEVEVFRFGNDRLV